MSRAQAYLDAGTTTDLGNGKHQFNVPLHIPATLIDQYEVFEIFAGKYGWTKEIYDLNSDGSRKIDGAGNPIMIPNPESPIDKCISVVRDFAWEVLTAALKEAARKQAEEAAEAAVAQFRE